MTTPIPVPPSSRPRVVVVGGGISGLTAALRLAAAADVLVLEAAPRTGGVLQRAEVGGVVLDTGAESLLARRPEAVALARAVGLGADLVEPATTRAALRVDGRLHPLPPGTLLGVPGHPERLQGLLTEADVARVAAEPGLPAPPLADDVAVGAYVASRMGPAVVARLVEPLLGGVYAGRAAALSLQAAAPQLWAHAARGGSLLHAVQERTSAPGTVAAPVFAGISGGVARLPDAVRDALTAAGGAVRCGVDVRALARTGAGWAVETGAGTERADAVVLAVPAPVAARLLAPAAPAAAAELAPVETASTALAALAVPTAQLAGLDGSGVLVPPAEGAREGLQAKALTLSASKWDWVRAQRSDVRVLRVSLGRAGEDAVLDRDDDDLLRTATADASRLLGRELRPVDAALVRWRAGLPQYAVGHAARVRRLRAAVADVPGLAVCGSVLDGVGVPACVAAAERAAQELLAQLAAAGVAPGAAAAGGRMEP
ncbi:oxygen-dependent protoporphyrinogen oxidase [Kineococcus xinjiangensis]|uniref:Coproporphyrinogen III oxidase n=1 Tax=Kineococcus xinjiangensis TaxID=512762 RepID=A0A2S6INY6_9ACTN|nr:protoporphyrinogen oxidase [Kineococcus xinjiangensis]PPK95918.1 oxygen-dependent protoporphyrinogen oxidase [Kineococcus xinjiangensis]